MEPTIRVAASICAQCGELYPKDARGRRFCSKACRYRSWALSHRHQPGRKPGRPRGRKSQGRKSP